MHVDKRDSVIKMAIFIYDRNSTYANRDLQRMNRLSFVIWFFPLVTIDACEWVADGWFNIYAFEIRARHTQNENAPI